MEMSLQSSRQVSQASSDYGSDDDVRAVVDQSSWYCSMSRDAQKFSCESGLLRRGRRTRPRWCTYAFFVSFQFPLLKDFLPFQLPFLANSDLRRWNQVAWTQKSIKQSTSKSKNSRTYPSTPDISTRMTKREITSSVGIFVAFPL